MPWENAAGLRVAGSTAVLVDWVKDTPRAGNIGANPELFSLLIEHWVASALLFLMRQTLLAVLHVWQNDQAQWLQRIIHASPKLGWGQRLRRLDELWKPRKVVCLIAWKRT